MSHPDALPAGRLPGYPDDARLLLINADDFGMYPATSEATVRAFADGIVRSASLMAPCPGAAHAMRLLRDTPGLRFGVHLAIVNDIAGYRWGPIAPRDRVPSLLDEDGWFFRSDRLGDMLERAELAELEIEFRAQIGAVLAAALRPTHLDWHCLYNGGRADIFDLSLGLAWEHGLALRVDSPPFADRVRRMGLPTPQNDLFDSFAMAIDEKPGRYAAKLRALPAGLSAWALHPGLDTADARATDPDGWRIRQSDFAFLASPLAREIVQQEGITLIDYAPLQAAWHGRPV